MAVIDASALAGWVLPDEAKPDLTPVLSEGLLAAPWLIWVELRNILITVERRGRLEQTETAAILDAVDALQIALDTAAAGSHVMALARRHRLTVYDALYLELALRRGEGLATLDKALINAAKIEGVEVL